MQKSTIAVLIVAVLIVALGAVLVFLTGDAPAGGGDTVDNAKLVEGARNVIGSPLAPVAIVEFGDFECPSCGAVHPTVKRILGDYGNQVRFVYRHFPLSQHRNARPAALAAEAAGLQGKFWEMHDKLFENQNRLDEASLRANAEEMGLDMAKFDSDRDSAALASLVNLDAEAARGFVVTATPTFFINGKRFVGGVSYQTFQSEIQRIISESAK